MTDGEDAAFNSRVIVLDEKKQHEYVMYGGSSELYVMADLREHQHSFENGDKICMMMTRLACNRAIESSYWRMDSDSDVGLLTSYVLYRLPVELEFMDLDTFPR